MNEIFVSMYDKLGYMGVVIFCVVATAAYIVREVLKHRSKQSLVPPDGKVVCEEHKVITDKVNDVNSEISYLVSMHNKFDEDGLPVWYVRPSLERVIKELLKSLENLTKALDGISHKQEIHDLVNIELVRSVDKIIEKQNEIILKVSQIPKK